MAIVLGLNAKLYYGTSAGSYTEMENVRDLSLSMETAEADVTTRAADGWRQSVATLKDATLEIEMLCTSYNIDRGATGELTWSAELALQSGTVPTWSTV